MKRKHLEGILQSLDGFTKPNVKLEQYTTGVQLTIDVVNHVYEDGYIDKCLVVDLGCGTGMLSAAASVMGASRVIGVDVDGDALDVCNSNLHALDITGFDLVQCDVTSCSFDRFRGTVDTVIMNPPFGTKNNQGTDVEFVRQALSFKPRAIYSMHKTSTRKHMLKIGKELGANASVVAELRFDLPSTYRFHKKQSLDIQVDLIRFECDT